MYILRQLGREVRDSKMQSEKLRRMTQDARGTIHIYRHNVKEREED